MTRDELLANLRELRELRGRTLPIGRCNQTLDEAIRVIENDVHVPGTWTCPLCGFVQEMLSLNANDGTVRVRSESPDPCPNDGHALDRLTWKAHALEARKLYLQAVEGRDA